MGNPLREEFVDNSEIARLSDQELTLRLQCLAADERASLVTLLAHLAEFDRRKLYGPLGCSSLFVYCTTRLRFSEEAAYRRIHAARVSQKYPEVLPMIAEGRLQLSAIAILSAHLTDKNRLEILDRACDKSYRDVLRMAASLAPQPEKADVIRRLSASQPEPEASGELDFSAEMTADEAGATRAPGLSSAAPSPVAGSDGSSSTGEPCAPPSRGDETVGPPRPPGSGLCTRIEPVAPDRIRFSFTGNEALLRKVERAQAILWHKHPAGKLEDIFAEALDFLLDKKDPQRRLEKKRRLKRKPPSSAADKESRRIPQWVKDEVWARDGGQCVFVPPGGERCREREGLEFDHIMPWALGGRSFDPRNIRLLCREHNQMRARRMFGEGRPRA